MKRILLLSLIIICANLSFAQYLPKGMNYQAVARDGQGKVMANSTITLRISLIGMKASDQKVHYVEIHRVTTNEFGVFNVVVGNGSVFQGSFFKIPWSSEEIWMAIDVKSDQDADYTPIVNSKLLAVPYAFHAGTANEIVAPANNYVDPLANIVNAASAVPSANWSCKGNSGTKPPQEYLGTSDFKDLVIKTNSLTRLVITANGDINISNSLNVGKDVTIGQDLYVTRNVYLNTGLTGQTINNGPFSVNNGSATILTGTLRNDGDATFKQHVTLDNASLNSTSPSTGALVVAGGEGIGKNLNVGGDLSVDGKIDVDGAATLNNTLVVNGATSLKSTLEVDGVTTLNEKLNAKGQVTIDANVTGGDGSYGAYPLRVQGSDQGIAIKVSNGTPSTSNNFVTFFNSSNGAVGRIEGQTLAEWHLSFDFIFETTFFALDEALTIAHSVAAGVSVPPDVAEAAVSGIEGAALATHYATWAVHKDGEVGVAFETGGADYAEWLEKKFINEKFSYGDIVGVKGGMVSKSLDAPDQYMVVSKRPIVLGNMPPQGKEEAFEKIAFLGQVDVKVRGKVNVGDYIIASTLNDGFGTAVSPNNISFDQYQRVVGVAWSASDDNAGNSMINVAVGINSNDAGKKMKQQEAESIALKKQLNMVVAYLKAKDPSFDVTPFEISEQENNTLAAAQDNQKLKALVNSDTKSALNNVIIELEGSPDLVSKVQAEARKMLDAKGVNYKLYDQTNRMVTDPHYYLSVLKEYSK
jgi:hypothetical protein